jgi:hypothetical protein
MSVPIGTQIFNKCDPLAHAGDVITIKPIYHLQQDKKDLLSLSGPEGVQIAIEGPRLKLEPADIAGVYPAPGSANSPANFLPHIAFNRRTFPWERSGPANAPWLALLMVKASEMTSGPPASTTVGKIAAIDNASYDRFHNPAKMNLPDATSVFVANLPNSLLGKILPRQNEIELLCHLKRVLYENTEGIVDDTGRVLDDNGKVIEDVAIVVGNRLPTVPAAPDTPQAHTVLLVSLEQCGDLYNASGNFARDTATGITTLAVLYSWTFTPAVGGDFEEVMQNIRTQPNGGVLRFGSEAWPADEGSSPLAGGFEPLLNSDGHFLDPLPHDPMSAAGPADVIEVRGPLRPFPLPADPRTGIALRSDPDEFVGQQGPKDYSYAVAFELGRLLALSNSTVLQALCTINNLPDRIFNATDIVPLPNSLQIPVMGDEGWEQPWAQSAALIKDQNSLLQNGVGDVTGIASQLQQAGWQAGVLPPLAAAGPATALTAVTIDIDTALPDTLSVVFSDVRTAGN